MIYRKRDGTLEIKIILVGMLIGCSYLVGEDISKRYIIRDNKNGLSFWNVHIRRNI